MPFSFSHVSPHGAGQQTILPLEKALAALLSCVRPTGQTHRLPLLEASEGAPGAMSRRTPLMAAFSSMSTARRPLKIMSLP